MSQRTRTEAPRSMPRGGALLPEGERALGLCRQQRWQSGWRRD